MIKQLIKILGAGIRQIQLNTYLLLVAVLIIVIPFLFVWVGQKFFDVAYQNINTIEKEAVWLLHDSIELVFADAISNHETQKQLTSIVENQDKITKISIVQENDNDYLIRYSSNGAEIGLNAGVTQHQETVMNLPDKTSVLALSMNGVRIWQAFREVRTEDATYFIFTEHSFADIDSVMLARQQQVYLVLPVIFLFLIALAYWLVRQTHWQKKFYASKDKLKEQMMFTNTIAHELRAPLTAIRGYLSFLMESKNLSSEEQQYAKNIDLSSDRMLALITDFLEVARIQSGNLQLKFRDHDVRDTIRAVESEFKSIAVEKGLELKTSVPNRAVLAETDTQRLQQVLTNLVSNALKYTEKGSVTISLEQTRLKTVIVVKDTGLGIAAEDQSKLFGAFTRVGTADMSGETGTGLGMWITKQLIELLHGEVYVESIEGVGTHVKLTFDV